MSQPAEILVVDQYFNPMPYMSLFGLVPVNTWLTMAGNSKRPVLVVQIDMSQPSQVVPYSMQQVLKDM